MDRHEALHPPGENPLWSESHYFDFVDESLQGHVRVGLYPNLSRAGAWVYLLEDDRAGYGWHEENLPPGSAHGTCLRAPRVRLDYHPGETGTTWEFWFRGELESTGSNGTVESEIRLELEGRSDPFFYSRGRGFGDGEPAMPGGTDRYEQPVRVRGRVDVADRSWTVRAAGERDHSWGPRDWFGMNWVWCSGGFEDNTAFNLTRLIEVEDYVNGFWFDGSELRPLRGVRLQSAPPLGSGTARAWSRGAAPKLQLELEWEGGAADVEVRPFATTPIRWRPDPQGGPRAVEKVDEARLLFNRSPCRMRRDGVEGRGFVENGQGIDPD